MKNKCALDLQGQVRSVKVQSVNALKSGHLAIYWSAGLGWRRISRTNTTDPLPSF